MIWIKCCEFTETSACNWETFYRDIIKRQNHWGKISQFSSGLIWKFSLKMVSQTSLKLCTAPTSPGRLSSVEKSFQLSLFCVIHTFHDHFFFPGLFFWNPSGIWGALFKRPLKRPLNFIRMVIRKYFKNIPRKFN